LKKGEKKGGREREREKKEQKANKLKVPFES
jgi:hypothetical protein